MSDFNILRDNELMLAHIEAKDESGADFIDSWLHGEFTVLDSGRILIPESSFPRFILDAKKVGLTVFD